VALPRQYSALEGVVVDGVIRPITNLWWEYIDGKADNYDYSMTNVENLSDSSATMYSFPLGGRGYSGGAPTTVSGDGVGGTVITETRDGAISGVEIDQPGSGYTWATLAFPPESGGSGANATLSIANGMLSGASLIVGGQLILSYLGSDTLTLTVYGTDENYLPVQLALTGNTTVDNPFVHIDRIHREQGSVPMTLTHTAIDLTQTMLAVLAPKQEEAYFHTYRISTLSCKQNAIVRALAKLRFVPFESDQDVLPFTSVTALELGMQAINFEFENDLTTAQTYWNKAIEVLNNELYDSKAVDEWPVIRMIYPGHTEPHWTSHY
jgi:hypothetical protein